MTRTAAPTPPRLTPFTISYVVIVGTLIVMFWLGVSTSTGVRGFVGGESSWSKAQKEAAAYLQQYAIGRDEADYKHYLKHLELLHSAHNARVELQKDNPDMKAAIRYLIGADADSADAPAMAVTFRRFRNNDLIREVFQNWELGDQEIAKMESIAIQLRQQAALGRTHDNPKVAILLHELRESDTRVTVYENAFSKGLGRSSRHIRRVMLTSVIIAGLAVLLFAVLISSGWIRAWRDTQKLASDRAARMRAVAAAAAGVGAVSTLEELDVVLHGAIARVIEMNAYTFGSYDPATRMLKFLPTVGDGVAEPEEAVAIDGTPTARFLTDRTSFLVHSSNDPLSCGTIHFGDGRSSESVIRCPMYSGSRLLGIISVHSYTPSKYTSDDVEVMDVVASVAESAMERIESTHERNIAEEGLRRSEEQLAQAHKMEAVGLLAGGVAHDFNNLLTAIKGNSDLLASDASLPEELREHVTEITAAADRAAALTGQLLAFSRRQVLQPRVVDLNALVVHITALIRRLIGEDVALLTSLDTELGRVRADPHQMEQVILNLALNARDAMSQNGSLVIETSNVELSESDPDMPSVPPGSYIRLSVQDTGIGISDESRARIFEPFFTTKGVGKGTGLGLSTVYGIVKQSGGHIYVKSAPGMGTTMQIFLPRTLEELDPPLPDETVRSRVVPSQRATILIVEDELTVRTLLSRVLSREGYTVVEAGSGEEAMAILASELDVDLVLTDTVMPGMSGVELARRAVELKPGLAILHMSGYTEDEVFRRGLSGRGDAFLQKPFAPAVVLNGVAEALTKARRSAGA